MYKINFIIPTRGRIVTPHITMLYNFARLVVMTPCRQPIVSYNRTHSSFGVSCTQWVKDLENDACDGGGFEEDIAPAYAWACFMVSSSSFFQRALNFRCCFWPQNLLNKFIKSLFLKWVQKNSTICLIWTSGHNRACVPDSCCSWCITTNILECMSLINQTSGQVPTTCAFTCSRKQY
jgi:hypothetical protein